MPLEPRVEGKSGISVSFSIHPPYQGMSAVQIADENIKTLATMPFPELEAPVVAGWFVAHPEDGFDGLDRYARTYKLPVRVIPHASPQALIGCHFYMPNRHVPASTYSHVPAYIWNGGTWLAKTYEEHIDEVGRKAFNERLQETALIRLSEREEWTGGRLPQELKRRVAEAEVLLGIVKG
ncbi:MAG: hypothetical protein ACYCPS_06225 [Candidatus Saccharimonadales bacterium]